MNENLYSNKQYDKILMKITECQTKDEFEKHLINDFVLSEFLDHKCLK